MNELENKMLVWIHIAKERGNVIMNMYLKKSERMVDKSNQESTNSFVNFFTCLLLMSFHYFTFFCTGEGFSFLTQQYNNSMYNKSYK